ALRSALESFCDTGSESSVVCGDAPAEPPQLCFTYSGMGPQWWRMGRDLLESEPVFRQAIQSCDAVVREIAEFSLLEEMLRDEHSSRVQQTHIAQPVNFALQLGLTELWRSRGVVPNAVVGHSVGEIAAACVAGVLSLEQAARIVCHRGRLLRA